MNWTKAVPTAEGLYLWRNAESSSGQPCWVIRGDDGKLWRDGRWVATFGEWCRLVPADVVNELTEAIVGLCEHIPAAEDHAQFTPLQQAVSPALKALNRAKRVMEGRE